LVILGLAGLPKESQATPFTFNNGDLVLAIYGSSNEFYYDIGQFSAATAPGARTIDLTALGPNSPFAQGAGVIGANTQWTILGANLVPTTPTANGVFTFTASQFDTSQFVPPTGTGTAPKPSINATNSKIGSWNSELGQLPGAAPGGTGAFMFLSSAEDAAFSKDANFGLGGLLGGTWGGGNMQGLFNTTLSLIQGRARNETGGTNVLSDIGRAILTADGQLTICGGAGCSVTPVPIPAAVVLFGSGLIGLIGIARRTRTGKSA
jgi:hypothetical protein